MNDQLRLPYGLSQFRLYENSRMEKDMFTRVYDSLHKNNLTNVEVNPIMKELDEVTIRWGAFEASGHIDDVIAAIENANDGDYESLRRGCEERGLLEQ